MTGATTDIGPNARVAASGASAVRLASIRKSYGSVLAVDGVDLDVADGEFFTMLGPSGLLLHLAPVHDHPLRSRSTR